MEKEKTAIKINLSDVVNKFLIHLKDLTDHVRFIYHAIDNTEIDIQKQLPTDSFPIMVNDKRIMPTIEQQKQLSINWVLNGAFEDIIKGLTISFKEAYKYLEIHKLSQEAPYTKTNEELKMDLQKIEADMEQLNFPDFINRMEILLKQTLPLKEEILSINRVRNCLVHRNGRVGKKDVDSASLSGLQLKWISLKFWTKINNQQTAITYDLRKDGITLDNISYKVIKNEKSFQVNDKISLDINQFNSIAYTCSTFVQELFARLPRQDRVQKKSA